jgi:hypothetical protein
MAGGSAICCSMRAVAFCRRSVSECRRVRAAASLARCTVTAGFRDQPRMKPSSAASVTSLWGSPCLFRPRSAVRTRRMMRRLVQEPTASLRFVAPRARGRIHRNHGRRSGSRRRHAGCRYHTQERICAPSTSPPMRPFAGDLGKFRVTTHNWPGSMGWR